VQVPENLVYKRLEDGWNILQSVRHDELLIMAGCGTKLCLSLVSLQDIHQVIRASEIQFCEEACSVK
jgi:hypothetical protein